MNSSTKTPFLLLLYLGFLAASCGKSVSGTPHDPSTTDPGDSGREQPGPSCQTDSGCASDETCVDNVCQKKSVKPGANNRQEKNCSRSSECQSSETCINGLCKEKDDRCKQIQCPNDYYQCVEGVCSPICGNDKLCGGGCCSDSQTCFENACITTPPNRESDDAVLCQTTPGEDPIWCGENQGCFANKCIDLANSCDEAAEEYCKITHYCDSGYNRCVKYEDNPSLCIHHKTIGTTPKEIIHWNKGDASPQYNQVMSSPAVANVFDNNGDGKIDEQDTSEIIFTTFHPSYRNGDPGYRRYGVLRVVSGEPDPNDPTNANELWSSSSISEPFWSMATTTPAIADINNDGKLEIIVEGYDSTEFDPEYAEKTEAPKTPHLFVLSGTGDIVWKKPVESGRTLKGPIITDLDGDGTPEIIAQSYIFDPDGNVKCRLNNGDNYNQVSNVLDLNGDGRQEILADSWIYTYNPDGTCTPVQEFKLTTYYSAFADLTGDNKPNLTVSYGGDLYLLSFDSQTLEPTVVWKKRLPIDTQRLTKMHIDCATKWHKYCHPGGGTPTIADFDNDGQPEIGIAARWYYFVFETNGDILWAEPTQDFSSAGTSSSVFDFNGDGAAEVVYNDEQYLRIYSGTGLGQDTYGDGLPNGNVLIQIPNITGTLAEYPVIADVNHDGHANVVVGANNYSGRNGKTGIRVFAHEDNNWVSTRSIWNQFAYNVTNIRENGSIPNPMRNNWEQPWLNNYLQNVQKGNPNLAPNAKPIIRSVMGTSCGVTSTHKEIVFDIKNIGSSKIYPKTVSYTVVANKNSETHEIATGLNDKVISPNDHENISISWEIPDTWADDIFDIEVVLNKDQSLKECIYDDNTAKIENIQAASPNLSVKFNKVDVDSCTATQMIKVLFEVTNSGNLDVPADSTTISFYAGLEGNQQPIGTYTIPEIIKAEGSYNGTYEWQISADLLNQPIYIRATIDEENKIAECDENDNEFSHSSSITCFVLG